MLSVPIDLELTQGKFIRRVNRFMVLAEVGGEQVYAHLPNSGRLATTLYPGVKLYLKRAENILHRKSTYSIFAASRNDNSTIIVDAQFSNYLARKAVEGGIIDGLEGYKVVKENIKPEGSNVRIDFLLGSNGSLFYLEVKIVTHVVDGVALFPDSPTLRGRRHLIELSRLSESGFKTGLMFSVQRPDAVHVKPNYDVDPEFASLLKASAKKGLKIFTLRAVFIPQKDVAIWPNEPPFSF
ncbi:MAG: DNA/RNA nuclease SfsA [Candidatus Bathyarchaeia archaeon]